MSLFLLSLNEYLRESDDSLSGVPAILDSQSAKPALGASRANATGEWVQQQKRLNKLLYQRTEESLCQALRTFVKIVDTLDLYAPTLKGLQEVHAFVCDKLEKLIFDRELADTHVITAAYLYGQAMAMSSTTSEAVSIAVDQLISRETIPASSIAVCILLGVERSSQKLFEDNLWKLLSQTQLIIFRTPEYRIPREALQVAMRVYSNTERAVTCQILLKSVHAILSASLQLCETPKSKQRGVRWVCYILQLTPILLRMDLREAHRDDYDAAKIFSTLIAIIPEADDFTFISLASALPSVVLWETQAFVDGPQLGKSVEILLDLPNHLVSHALQGLGDLAVVVLDKFEPFVDVSTELALKTLNESTSEEEQIAAKTFLRQVLAACGPMTLNSMVEYLHCPPSTLLADVQLLEQIATLLPNLASRIVQTLVDLIDGLFEQNSHEYDHTAVLQALTVFPLDDLALVQRAQRLVIDSLDEEKGKEVVMTALELATNPNIAVQPIVRKLTFKSAQLLLADDAHIVHVALNVLSNPTLASMLDERSCSMILLALHQSLEPSIQIVAAKLLTHLTTAHRAIVQPLAWSHIRQSLSLMDFLHSVDPCRAIVEACIISNLLPALPSSLHQKYVGPVKKLILDGLRRAGDGHSLSLIFQGLANLAKFEGWSSAQQADLILSLLQMTQDIPKSSQHSALNAISKLLSVPLQGMNTYELLINVQAIFGSRATRLDADLKALVSGIYGHLGTIDRNPVISRDSRAAIERETSVYTRKSRLLSQVAEVRDRSGANSQTHINWLTAKNLVAALAPPHAPADERSSIMEIMTSFGILQPSAIPALIPDFPPIVLAELRASLEGKVHRHRDGTHKDVTPVPAAVVFLATALHTSPMWLYEYWMDTAEVMADAVTAGQALPVLRGLNIVLDTIIE